MRRSEPNSEGPGPMSTLWGHPPARCAVAACAESLAALNPAVGPCRTGYVGNACWALLCWSRREDTVGKGAEPMNGNSVCAEHDERGASVEWGTQDLLELALFGV